MFRFLWVCCLVPCVRPAVNKQEILNAEYTSHGGASLTHNPNSVNISSTNYHINLLQKDGYDLKLSLDRTWSLGVSQSSTLKLILDGYTPDLMTDTDMLLVVSVGDVQYFSFYLHLDSVRNIRNGIYSSFATDAPPVSEWMNDSTLVRWNRISNNSQWEVIMDSHKKRSEFPLEFVILNDDANNECNFEFYHNASNTPRAQWSFGRSFRANQPIDMYIMADDLHEQFTISSVRIELLSEFPNPTVFPTPEPSTSPSRFPTSNPTQSPSVATKSPTQFPTNHPSNSPTESPLTVSPTRSPSPSPTETPTPFPTPEPTGKPSSHPTNSPSGLPTSSPSGFPTDSPSRFPTESPTKFPTEPPSESPSEFPSSAPSMFPSSSPSRLPTDSPSKFHTNSPTRTLREATTTASGTSTEAPMYKPTTAPSYAGIIIIAGNKGKVIRSTVAAETTEMYQVAQSTEETSRAAPFFNVQHIAWYVAMMAAVILCCGALMMCALFRKERLLWKELMRVDRQHIVREKHAPKLRQHVLQSSVIEMHHIEEAMDEDEEEDGQKQEGVVREEDGHEHKDEDEDEDEEHEEDENEEEKMETVAMYGAGEDLYADAGKKGKHKLTLMSRASSMYGSEKRDKSRKETEGKYDSKIESKSPRAKHIYLPTSNSAPTSVISVEYTVD